jgi:anti-sigma factor RsiW
MNAHVDFDLLSDLASGDLAEPERRSVERHVVVCAECAERLSSLRELLERAHALPRGILPPDDVWSDIRAELERRAVRQPVEARRHAAWWRRSSTWVLAAAAVVLVVSSSAITALVLRQGSNTGRAIATNGVPDDAHSAQQLPAALAIVEAGYDGTARELEATLSLQRHRLAPSTIATVERSLIVIDSAIAEARRALLDDPSNRALVDIFAANYERKLELLRRATELTSSL